MSRLTNDPDDFSPEQHDNSNHKEDYTNPQEASDAAPVQSVNSQTGAVSVVEYSDSKAADASPVQNVNGKTGNVSVNEYSDAKASAAAPVQSVDGNTGNVTTFSGDYSDLTNVPPETGLDRYKHANEGPMSRGWQQIYTGNTNLDGTSSDGSQTVNISAQIPDYTISGLEFRIEHTVENTGSYSGDYSIDSGPVKLGGSSIGLGSVNESGSTSPGDVDEYDTGRLNYNMEFTHTDYVSDVSYDFELTEPNQYHTGTGTLTIWAYVESNIPHVHER